MTEERCETPARTYAEAVSAIEPLPGDGPNRFTSYVAGDEINWNISAQTVRELKIRLAAWFDPANSEDAQP